MADHNDSLSSYRHVFKAISFLGGVKVIEIFVSIIRSKFVAILLGPAGMGIVGLLTSTIGLIGSLIGIGLNTSAVRDVSIAYDSGDEKRIGIVVTILRRLVWITGFLGITVTFILSGYLSQLTFGNKDYTSAFKLISIVLFFNQLQIGQTVLLQGLRRYRYMAKSALLGNILGLLLSVPIYYLYGKDGIVPVIIITSLITLSFSWYFSKKMNIKIACVTLNQFVTESSGMVKMGIVIALTGLVTVGTTYIIRIFISRMGNVEDVGLYTAGMMVVTTYVGLILTAMTTDYLPRLSGNSHNKALMAKTINQQAEIVLLLMGPVIIIFLVFVKFVIIILYSREFVQICEMIQWAAIGMLFRAASWLISYAFVAKGDSKIFFWNELAANTVTLGLHLAGYIFWGLAGLGIGFLLSYIIYLMQLCWLAKRKYEFVFSKSFCNILFIQMAACFSCFLIVVNVREGIFRFMTGLMIFAFTARYSVIELNRRMDLLGMIKNKNI